MDSYSEILNFLYQFTPAYHRIGTAAFKPGLEKSIMLDEYFRKPHQSYITIHVGGTNGKGSVSHAIAAVLIHAGYKVGLYTSPHLVDFTERFKVNGKNAPHEFVVNFVKKHQEIIFKLQPSFFEYTTFMAFEYFKEQQVDVAVIEVGMGGRLDTTNVINPILSIITNISYDHQMFLGNTLEKIAFEKAGIIKPNIPVIIGEHHPETDNVFLQKAAIENAPITFAEDEFHWELIQHSWFSQTLKNTYNGKIYTTDLIGNYQQKNLKTILLAINKLKNQFSLIQETILINALKNIKKISGLKGRMEFIQWKEINVLLDVAHNISGISHLLQNLKDFETKKLHFVLGFVSDKDVKPMLALFPKDSKYYFIKPNVERGLEANILNEWAQNEGLIGKIFINWDHLNNELSISVKSDELIIICGSCFLVADFLKE